MTARARVNRKKKYSQNHSQANTTLVFQKVILKISGEIFGKKNHLLHSQSIGYITEQIATAHALGVRLGVVIGGGNIIRGRDIGWLNNVDADTCGMIATMINGIVLSSQLAEHAVLTKLSSGIEVAGVVNRCNKFEDTGFYSSGGVLIFVGGTGNPLFTTDTAAALRAVEFNADVLIKGTKVEGVYSADPKKSRHASLYRALDFDEAIAKKLAIMDLAAFNICKEANIPICVYDFMKYPLSSVLRGDRIGTLITKGRNHDRKNY
jgi:uridylate kinase